VLPVLGIDFDNTIASYDDLLFRAAVDRGLIQAGGDRTKRAVRDRIRLRPDGEIEWQKLQALVYGPLMPGARPTDGVCAFIGWCRDAGIAVFIVSHKTRYANYDETGTDLRIAALEWMTAQRFFDEGGLGLSRDAVFFESTREDKIARIRSLGCSHFIDDLEEVFLEPSFPANVRRILYAPGAPGGAASASAVVLRSWQAVRDYFVHCCA